jgi:hypothetical protein
VLGGGILAVVLNAGAMILGISPAQAQVFHLYVFLCVGVSIILTIEWHVWPTTLAYLAAFLLSAASPPLTLWYMSASNAVLAINAFVIWGDGRGLDESDA